MINVAICDDAKYLCDGFCEQFSHYDDIVVTGIAYSAAECLEMIEKSNPDILLLDIRMKTEIAGINIIPSLKKEKPNLKIIMLTSYNDESYIFAAFANGADDYCEKTLAFDDIVTTVRNVYQNTSSLRPEIAKKLVQKTRKVNQKQQSLLFLYNKIAHLSPGEFELLRTMYYGGSYKIIAEEKFVEISSVERMAKRLLKRMEAKNMNILLSQLHELHIFEVIDQGNF